jgi:hypothetical protein
MVLSQQQPLRLEALYALDRYQERALPVLPDLLPLLSDSDDDIRYWTTVVVGNFASSESSVRRCSPTYFAKIVACGSANAQHGNCGS